MTRSFLAVAALVASVALLPAVQGPPAAARTETGTAGVAARVRRAVADGGVGRASVAVWDAETRKRIVAHEADTPRRLASVTKLASTYGALIVLGPDHELTTEVRCRAEVRGGVVDGDLIVVGGGDPGFSEHLSEDGAEAAVARLARDVAARGVREIRGDLVLDTSAFQGLDRHPGWDWKPGQYDWWSAPVTALTLNDACLDVTVHPGDAPGDPAVILESPRNSLVEWRNELLTTRDKGEHSISFRLASGGAIPAKGRVWLRSTGYEVSLACVDPPLLFGDVFRRSLSEAGVVVRGRTRVARELPFVVGREREAPSGVLLARHGTRVADVVRVANTRSQNLYAELLSRAVGIARDGNGSFAGGASAVREALGFEPDDVSLSTVDGSGLARENTGTVDGVGRILLDAFHSKHRLVFMESLARAGQPVGTLRKRFREPRFKDRVLAKTGTLRDTSALAGYVRSSEGRVYAFAILCEGRVSKARRMQDRVVSALVGD